MREGTPEDAHAHRGSDRFPTFPVGFHRRHLGWPVVAFVALVAAIAAFDIDRRWANAIYAWQGNTWALKTSFVAETLVHTGGRYASICAWIVVLVLWCVALAQPRYISWRRPLAYLLIATAVAAAAVAWMKSWTNMDCPWDVAGLGGERPYHPLWGARAAGHRGTCFPAAHASAGYCWLALYFFLASTRPKLRWYGLSLALGLGLVAGFTQQLRGAHFLSHDLWSLAVCWTCVLTVHAVMFRRFQPVDVPTAPVAIRPR